MVFTGFDQWFEILGGGYHWGSYCHQSGHLVNLQEHPAVKRLLSILCQLVNCKSFEIFTYRTEIESNNDNFRPTDSITTLLDIVAKTSLPITALTVNFMGNGFGYTPDPQQLQASGKDQFAAIGQHLKDLMLLYTLEHGIVRDWTLILQTCQHSLQVLRINMMRINADSKGVKQMFQTLSTSFPALELVSFGGLMLGVQT